MSLILEALKKSERQRQVGIAPTLATPPMSRKRKRSLLPWLIAAIVIAGGAGWWLSRETVPEPAPVVQTTPAPAASAPVAARASKPEVPMTTVAPPPEPSPPAATVAQPSAQQIDQLAKAVAAAAPDASNPPAPVTIPRPASASPPPAPAPTPQAVPTNPVAPPPAAAVAVSPPAPAPASAAPSAAASLPLLWELPYDKRKDIPALTMSLQVYSDDPSQRFAIVNDERHVEGDELGDGLTLKEIAPEGLIVEYHGERFLFPRGGR